MQKASQMICSIVVMVIVATAFMPREVTGCSKYFAPCFPRPGCCSDSSCGNASDLCIPPPDYGESECCDGFTCTNWSFCVAHGPPTTTTPPPPIPSHTLPPATGFIYTCVPDTLPPQLVPYQLPPALCAPPTDPACQSLMPDETTDSNQYSTNTDEGTTVENNGK